MKRILVKASEEYEVMIGNGLLQEIGNILSNLVDSCKAVIVSETNVFPLYGKMAEESLEAAGFEVLHYVFPAGEQSKNLQTYGHILNFLAENHVGRSDVLVALGGGVTGDLCGFTAATYLRGIRYVQVPTTLLSAVDSSVGGKTAVDLDCGKNLAGAFYQPALVLCDPDCLNTLPPEVFADGCAEVIKYGVLGNEEFFRELDLTPAKEQIEHVIATCVEMKRTIVAEDEFDTGLRRILNLGHTFGHAVEARSNFKISHGSAVAIGMVIIAQAAAEKGFCSKDVPECIINILKKYNLPTETDFSAEELLEPILSDKKTQGKSINLIVPTKIGDCKVEKVLQSDIPNWLKAGGIQ